MDAVLAARAYDLPLPSAPIYSIETFESMPVDITIAEYTVLYCFVKITAALSLATIVCSLTCLMRRYLSALITVIAATILPAIFSGFGLSMFGYVDYIGFFRATPMMLHGLAGAGYMILFAAHQTAGSPPRADVKDYSCAAACLRLIKQRGAPAGRRQGLFLRRQ